MAQGLERLDNLVARVYLQFFYRQFALEPDIMRFQVAQIIEVERHALSTCKFRSRGCFFFKSSESRVRRESGPLIVRAVF